MDKRIEIKKRSSEGVVVWRVEAADVTPNTVIAPERGITLVITADGTTKVLARENLMNSLFNPGKKKKLIGGNKPYKHCEIYAVDQSSSFEAEWGLGGPTAIPCCDSEIGVDCTAVAFGTYTYTIGDSLGFRTAMQLDKHGVITREEIREFLRSETTGLIRAHISAQIGGKDWKSWPTDYTDMLAILKKEINKQLDSKGLEVTNVSIMKLSYDAKQQAVRERVGAVKAEVYIKKIENSGKRDDVDVATGYVSGVVVPIINAEKGIAPGAGTAKKNDASKSDDAPKTIRCPRCDTENPVGAIYCSRCSQRLTH